MDSADASLVLNTEIKEITYKIKWSIDNAHNIPKSIKSPNFSFAPTHSKDWFLTVEYREDGSICVFLSRDSEDEQPLRVECTTRVIDVNEESFSATVRCTFQSKETHIICNHLCTFSDELSENTSASDQSCADEFTLHLECSFLVYGLEVETEISYNNDQIVENIRSFGDVIKIENLADVQIHVGKEVFTAHKFILRLRAPNFVDKHLKYGNKTILRQMDSVIFKSVISYIYKNNVSSIELSQYSKELYEFAGKYGMKALQKICTGEIKEQLKFGNVIEYLKMAEKYQEESLKTAASSFIKNNLNEMYQRKDWTALIASQPHFESEVLPKSTFADCDIL